MQAVVLRILLLGVLGFAPLAPAAQVASAGSAATQTEPQNIHIHQIQEPPPRAPVLDPTVRIRTVDRIVGIAPKSVPLGSTFKMRIRFPPEKVLHVEVREISKLGEPLTAFEPKLEPTADGLTEAIIPVVRQGNVRFILSALFKDSALSFKQFSSEVTAPVEKPVAFVADRILGAGEHPIAMRIHIGGSLRLEPAIRFATSPELIILAHGTYTTSVVPQAGNPVVGIDADGSVRGLGVGDATVRVTIGDFTADQPVHVKPDGPTPHCYYHYGPDGQATSSVCQLEP